MLMEKNVVGKKEDWAEYITLSDEHETPLLRLLPKGPKPVSVVKNYQADTYDTPAPVAWPEGKDWSTFQSAGANRVELSSRVQKFVKTAAVGEFAQDLTQTAGIKDELAHEIQKKLTELARSIECSAGSDQVAFADDGQTGHMFRGVGKWIASTWVADADKDVASSILPAAAQVSTTATGSLTEDVMKGIFESMWTKTGSTGVKIGVVGSKTKNAFTGFQFYTPSTTATASTSRIVTRSESSNSLGNTVDRYVSDWGPVELHMTAFNQAAGFTGANATYAPYRSYFLNAARWSWEWNKKPTIYELPYRGGGYKAAIEAILMLLCKNPVGEGKWAPAS